VSCYQNVGNLFLVAIEAGRRVGHVDEFLKESKAEFRFTDVGRVFMAKAFDEI
jgi:hypothetical protein